MSKMNFGMRLFFKFITALTLYFLTSSCDTNPYECLHDKWNYQCSYLKHTHTKKCENVEIADVLLVNEKKSEGQEGSDKQL